MAGDTDFRKTWDKKEYAVKARENDQKMREEGQKRAEAAAQGKKYHRRASTPPDARATEARATRLDVSSMVGKSVLVGASSAVGRHGKGAGFYCELCNQTFKDSISFLDHQNSTEHLRASGETGQIVVADLETVRARLSWLSRKRKEAGKDQVVDLDARLELSREHEEKEREEKRRKRNEKRRKTPGGVGIVHVKMENDGIIS